MSETKQVQPPEPTFASEIELDPETNEVLPALLDQSLDCIKLIARDGTVQYMNKNGVCAMEVDDVQTVLGRPWFDLWPETARPTLLKALSEADSGGAVRFDAFCPTAKGSPRWWDVSVSRVHGKMGNRLGYLTVSRDVTQARVATEVAEIAAAEMRHRLKNSYAMVSGLLTALARGQPDREQFVTEIRDRLSALGVAQTLFVAGQHAPCDIRVLVPALLEPFSHTDCIINADSLPEALVDQGQADALALVFGELAVNSSKHGALSFDGQIGVSAERVDDELHIAWSERSPRAVESHARDEGQGLRLIHRILKARNGGLIVKWDDFGLDAMIRLRLAPFDEDI